MLSEERFDGRTTIEWNISGIDLAKHLGSKKIQGGHPFAG